MKDKILWDVTCDVSGHWRISGAIMLAVDGGKVFSDVQFKPGDYDPNTFLSEGLPIAMEQVADAVIKGYIKLNKGEPK